MRSLFFGACLLVLISAACAPQIFPKASTPTASPTATLSAIIPNTGLFANQEPNVVNKPQMGLGAAYRYFDGSLLDAVPNSGPFLMGAVSGGDNPQHQVTVNDYWIYSTEVTNQMYAWCVSLGKCTPPNLGDDPLFQDPATVNYPVVGVNWQQASDYCSFAHGRLPTEAEWEKAADWDAANKVQLLFPWGNQKASCDMLNFKYCVGHATQVLQYGQGRSFYNAYNLEGNVAEWVQDWYAPNYYQNSAAQDPAGPASGSARVIRGSAWDSDAMYASPTVRFWAAPTSHRNNLGFRCVVPDPSYYAPFCTQPVSYGVTAAGGSLQQCPDPGISDVQGCSTGNAAVDFVSIAGNSLSTVTVTGLEGCNPANNELGVKHVCPAGVTITVSTKCSATTGSPASCPPNYQQSAGNALQCTSPGAPGACPAGFSYDSSLQCCTIPAGSNAAPQPCPAGQHLFNGACVLDQSGLQQPRTITFTTGQVACVAGPNGISVTATPVNPTPTNPPTLPPPPTGTPLPTLVVPTLTPVPFRSPTPVPTIIVFPTPSRCPWPWPFCFGPTWTPRPTSTALPPSNTPLPPTSTSVPPTATSVPPTSVPPTATSVPPTNPPPPTDTSAPPTDTQSPATATSGRPDTQPSPTDTPAPPPTNSSAPATDTPAAPVPSDTPAAGSAQIVAVPLYIPAALVSNSLPALYPVGGSRKR